MYVCVLQQVQEQNLYYEGDKTPSNQLLSDFPLRRCWNDLVTKINYEDRIEAVKTFNKSVILTYLYS